VAIKNIADRIIFKNTNIISAEPKEIKLILDPTPKFY